MNSPIKVVSGAVGEGRSSSIAEFYKASPASLMKVEKPMEIFFSQATLQIYLLASSHAIKSMPPSSNG